MHRNFLIFTLNTARLITGNQIVLVLSGGAARGLAHDGLIKFLLEHNIPFDVVVGVSMGSEIGASYWYILPLMLKTLT